MSDRRHGGAGTWRWPTMTLGLAMISGCGIIGGGFPTDAVDGNRDPRASSTVGKISGEPNDTFEDAIVAVFDAGGTARLQGSISESDDLDVYRLGPLSAGDRIMVRVETSPSLISLDATVALFDADQNLFFDNDDYGGSLDPYVDEIIRHDSDPYYLVIGRSPFANRTDRTGAYRIDVTVIPDQPVPPPHSQTLFLDFDGGLVTAPSLGRRAVRPFDAGDIDLFYEGQTELIKSVIVETVYQNFEGFDIDIITSDEVESPEEPHSTVLFGGFEREAFGISETVDHFNENPNDMAIIFTESFSRDAFLFLPTAEEMGVAIGNIASHEAGHLLGLNHVDDPQALMDAVSPADSFLLDQEFIRAPLSSDILPIGFQDAAVLLAEIFGLL